MPPVRPSPLTSLTKLPARIRARGIFEVGSLAVDRVREAIYSEDRLIFFMRAAAKKVPDSPSPKAEGLRLKRALRTDSSAYARDIGTDSPSTFRSRLSESTRCYLVFEEERALHATWVTTSASWVREIARYFRPPQGDAYVYESFTRDDARGRGIYPLALRGICEDLANDGLDRVWVAVEADNPPSLKAVAKGGFEEAFELAYERRLGRLTVSEPWGKMTELCPGCFAKKLSE